MNCQDIHELDIGTIFEATIKDCETVVDVSSATTQEFIFRRPDGTSFIVTTVFKVGGADGIIQYTTILDDLDQPGRWRLQAHVILTGGEWHSSFYDFEVKANL